MKKYFAILVVLTALMVVQNATAQFVRPQTSFIGPVIAINLSGSNALFFGLNYEYMIKRDVGIGGVFRYFSYTAITYADGGSYVFSSEIIGAQANYHFKVAQNELDPYVGAIIGLQLLQGGYKNTTTTFGNPPSGTAGLVFDIQAGARYFFTDKFAGNVRLVFGSGYNALDLGVDIGL